MKHAQWYIWKAYSLGIWCFFLTTITFTHKKSSSLMFCPGLQSHALDRRWQVKRKHGTMCHISDWNELIIFCKCVTNSKLLWIQHPLDPRWREKRKNGWMCHISNWNELIIFCKCVTKSKLLWIHWILDDEKKESMAGCVIFLIKTSW